MSAKVPEFVPGEDLTFVLDLIDDETDAVLDPLDYPGIKVRFYQGQNTTLEKYHLTDGATEAGFQAFELNDDDEPEIYIPRTTTAKARLAELYAEVKVRKAQTGAVGDKYVTIAKGQLVGKFVHSQKASEEV